MQKIYTQKIIGGALYLLLFASAASGQVATNADTKDIMVNSSLTKGLDMKVASSEHVKKWVKKLPE